MIFDPTIWFQVSSRYQQTCRQGTSSHQARPMRETSTCVCTRLRDSVCPGRSGGPSVHLEGERMPAVPSIKE